MGSIVNGVLCFIGCVYFAVHLACVLTSVVEAITDRRDEAGQTSLTSLGATLGGDVTVDCQDAVGFEHETSS
jgi:hypothetical protein